MAGKKLENLPSMVDQDWQELRGKATMRLKVKLWKYIPDYCDIYKDMKRSYWFFLSEDIKMLLKHNVVDFDFTVKNDYTVRITTWINDIEVFDDFYNDDVPPDNDPPESREDFLNDIADAIATAFDEWQKATMYR